MPQPQSLTARKVKILLKQYADGITAQQMIDHVTAATGKRISLPTLRKYVQLGFLGRSTRRGLGYRQGSRGFYPAATLVQLLRVREQLKAGWTVRDLVDGSLNLISGLEDIRHRLEGVSARATKLLAPGRTAPQRVLRMRIEAASSGAAKHLAELERLVREAGSPKSSAKI